MKTKRIFKSTQEKKFTKHIESTTPEHISLKERMARKGRKKSSLDKKARKREKMLRIAYSQRPASVALTPLMQKIFKKNGW